MGFVRVSYPGYEDFQAAVTKFLTTPDVVYTYQDDSNLMDVVAVDDVSSITITFNNGGMGVDPSFLAGTFLVDFPNAERAYGMAY